MNRVQNESCICKCIEWDTKSWQCIILREYKEQNGWIMDLKQEKNNQKVRSIFNKDGTGMVTMEPQLQSDGRYYNQLIMIDCMEGNVIQLTKGKFVVTQILAWDEVSGTFYFIGTKENSPVSRHMYSVDVGGGKDIKCLTCNRKVRYLILVFL